MGSLDKHGRNLTRKAKQASQTGRQADKEGGRAKGEAVPLRSLHCTGISGYDTLKVSVRRGFSMKKRSRFSLLTFLGACLAVSLLAAGAFALQQHFVRPLPWPPPEDEVEEPAEIGRAHV